MSILNDVNKALENEIQALRQMQSRLDEEVVAAVSLLLSCRGRVIFTGMGKAGHIARKIAATFSSTGTPSIFMHPGEAYHGDLGVITSSDLAIILSNSGETDEVVKLIPCFLQFGIKCIALTGNTQSTLAKNSDIVLDTGVEREACPLNCAPTSSTTTALVMGDALACALIKAKGFTKADFARFHPGGSLGFRLLTKVKDVMPPFEETPVVNSGQTVREAIFQMSSKGLGVVLIIKNNKLLGIFTDGDLRRILEKGNCTKLDSPINEVMTAAPRTIGPNLLAAQAFSIMEKFRITILPVVNDKGNVLGCLQLHRLLNKGFA
ncbi:KpsF/GutQ family sugar-phosphate isomerase [Maridesulfovibrio bastinii]|uniref:KpsF/GutQ family sugar-phosphate isomerase n=1 Tax=Maridesulfovibrio bastinii TaxID=47157 RepID=UPI000425FE4E|nr:KpsF/GutQ family sugar-phosphate isomerase [Maridesulfovibrio bastinii]